jgi:hypothetical protein
MYLGRFRSQQSVYNDSLLSHLDSSLSDSLCSIFAFLLSLAWLLTVVFVNLEEIRRALQR